MLAEAYRLFVGPRAVDKQTREPSPARFLEIFPSVSGMKPFGQFLEENEAETVIPASAQNANIVGAIVVGSCAHPDSKPKDIDIFLIVNGEPNKATPEYSDALMSQFNSAYARHTGKPEDGRLDILAPLDSDFKLLKPKFRKILHQARNPIVYAFTRDNAQSLHEKITKI